MDEPVKYALLVQSTSSTTLLGLYRFETVDEILDLFSEPPEAFESFTDQLIAHRVLSEAVDLPDAAVLLGEPTATDASEAIKLGVVGSDELDQFEQFATTDTSDRFAIGESSFGPVNFPVVDGSITTIFGSSGTGKSVTALTFSARLRDEMLPDAKVVFATPLRMGEDFYESLGGTMLSADDEFSELSTYNHVHIPGGEVRAGEALTNSTHEFIDRLSEYTMETGEQIVFVLDEAHVLDGERHAEVIKQLRCFTSSFLVGTQPVHFSREYLDALDFEGQDGAIIHRVSPKSVDVLQEVFGLSLVSQIGRILTARTGKESDRDERPYSEMFVCPPQNTNWSLAQYTITDQQARLLNGS